MQIEGRNPVLESLRARKGLKVIYLEKDIKPSPKINTLRKLASKQGVPIKFRPRKFLNKISQTKTHQGVIAKRSIEQKSFTVLLEELISEGTEPFIIYIREALYEHNIGAIVRTAEGAGLHAVLIPPKIKLTPQIIRVSMGGTEHIEVINESLFQAIKSAKRSGLKVVGIEVSGENYYFEEDLTGPTLLIVGGEDRPLSQEIINKADAVIKIPLKGKLNSLNMSVAAAIVIYDKVRQDMTKR